MLTGHRYVITNYEQRNFSVAQSKFTDGSQSNIVAINSNSTSLDSRRQGIDHKSIIGAAVGSSVAALLLLFIFITVIRKRLRTSKSRIDTASSSPESSKELTHSDISVVEEIGNNSIYNAYPELHDTGRVEMLTPAIPPHAKNSIRELPQSSNSVLSHSERGLKIQKTVVNHIKATVVRRQKNRSINPNDRNLAGKRYSQHELTKAHGRPALSHIKSNTSVPPRKESSLTHQGTIHSTQPIGNRIEIASSEPGGHHELPVSLHSRLELDRTDSVNSTYANIIDYDYYRHGTPANEGNELSS